MGICSSATIRIVMGKVYLILWNKVGLMAGKKICTNKKSWGRNEQSKKGSLLIVV